MTPDVNVVTSRAILKETPMMMVGIRVIIWTRVMMSLDGFVDNHNEDDDDGDDDDGGGGDDDDDDDDYVDVDVDDIDDIHDY